MISVWWKVLIRIIGKEHDRVNYNFFGGWLIFEHYFAHLTIKVFI